MNFDKDLVHLFCLDRNTRLPPLPLDVSFQNPKIGKFGRAEQPIPPLFYSLYQFQLSGAGLGKCDLCGATPVLLVADLSPSLTSFSSSAWLCSVF